MRRCLPHQCGHYGGGHEKFTSCRPAGYILTLVTQCWTRRPASGRQVSRYDAGLHCAAMLHHVRPAAVCASAAAKFRRIHCHCAAVGNFSVNDYTTWAVATAASYPFGYIAGLLRLHQPTQVQQLQHVMSTLLAQMPLILSQARMPACRGSRPPSQPPSARWPASCWRTRIPQVRMQNTAMRMSNANLKRGHCA